MDADILIIGAGPAGCAAALFLAKAGIKSTLVDKSNFPRDKICGDALSGKVVEVLKKLDPIWHRRLAQDKQILGSWGVKFYAPDGNALRVPFRKERKENDYAPGFITPRLHFDNLLVEDVRANPLIQFDENTEIRQVKKETGNWLVSSKEGKSYSARLIIAADGPLSPIARHWGELVTEASHNCFGIRAYYEGVSDMDTEQFIELHFLPEILPGYFWIFPLPDGRANVGIGMRADKMQSKKINLKKSLEEIIQRHPRIASRFSSAKVIDGIKQWSLPLGSKRRKISGAGYLLTGDAAQLIDPFTGEGIGNALMSGMFAAETALAAIQQNRLDEAFLSSYDATVYGRLGSELSLSYRMQQLVNFPFLFNFIVRKANRNVHLRETISCMFEDLDLRAKLKSPGFYWKILFD